MQSNRNPNAATRRRFLATLAGAIASCGVLASAKNSRPRVLLRSSWQTVNIGDIAHTPGFLSLMETYLPGIETTLWPRDVGDGVRERLLQRFPNLKIAETNEEVEEAFAECGLFIHGSAASLSSIPEIERWEQATGKDFGVYAITFDDHQSWMVRPDSADAIQRKVEVLNRARFAFFRDRESVGMARRYGCECEVMGFAPDAAFACDLRDEDAATAFVKANDLREKEFLCCIPRLRFSPYWLMKKGVTRDEEKHRINEQMKEQDHAPLLEAVRRVAGETDMKVLLCPEDRSQVSINKEMIYDRLTPSERKRVVWKSNYWLTGEAISVYAKSAGLFGNEMHSPIMCVGQGVPAFVCRWEGQTSKGTMWKDIGLSEWLFNFDLPEDRRGLPDAVLRLAKNREASFAKASRARKEVQKYQQRSMENVKAILLS